MYTFLILDELQALFNSLLIQLRQIGGYWALGVFLGSIVSVYASEKITEYMTKLERGWLITSIAASALGIVSPLCMYGTIPIIAALARKKVPQSVLASFMVSSILLNPNLFIMSFALGAQLAMARLVSVFLIGTLAGVFTHIFFKKKPLYNFSSFEQENKKKKKTFISDILKSIRITGPYFLIGIALTAIVDRYLPREWVVAMFSNNRGLGVLLAASIGVPIYVCGGGTIPLLKAWLGMGMSPGSAMAFMISGPATKITNLGAVKIVLGARNFILYLFFMILSAILSGWIMDFAVIFIKL